MSMWVPFKPVKALPHEKKNAQQKNRQKERHCRICGALVIDGTICHACKAFIEKMRKEERQAQKHGRQE